MNNRQFLFSNLLLCLILSSCTMCDKPVDESLIPKTLRGRTLKGEVTFGSGAFSSMKGYSFSTSFEKGRVFKTVSSTDTVDSEGEYTYKRLEETKSRLILTDRSTLHEGMQIEITLNFTSPTSGTFDGRYLSGQAGVQNGTFEIEEN